MNMALAIIAVLLVLVAGYLIGSQHERDRHHNRRHAAQAAAPATSEPLITDRDWEHFVIAIYDLADRDDGQT